MRTTRRRLITIIIVAGLGASVLVGCESTPKKPESRAKPSPSDPEAQAHVEQGLEIWKGLEDARDPRDTLARALAELEKARERVPSPENRFLCARVAHLSLVQDSTKKPADEDLAKIVESLKQALTDDPDHARALGLLAVLEVSSSSPDYHTAAGHAEHALEIAAVVSSREIRCFVGDEVADAAKVLWRRDPVRAGALMLGASKLGSPSAIVNMAKLAWEGRGQKIDREAAIRLAKQASEVSFTPEERARGLLVNESFAARFAARLQGNYLVQLARFEEAIPALEQGTMQADDILLPNDQTNPDFLNAVAQLGEIEALSLAPNVDKQKGRDRLAFAATRGHAPSHVVLGRIEAVAGKADAAQARFEEAERLGSKEALACLGKWDKLAEAAASEAAAVGPSKKSDSNPEIQLYALRNLFLALAMDKGTSVREQVEEEARKAAEPAPKTRPSARQLRHIAGDMSADELQATMPVSALLPRWRAETELALAIRALLLGDKPTAKTHLEKCIDARAITNSEGELAWAALRGLK